MSTALDAGIIVIILGLGVLGYVRGVSGSIRSLIVIGVAALMSLWFAQPLADSVYDSKVKGAIEESFEETLSEGSATETVKKTIEEKFDIKLTDKELQQISQSDKTIAEEIQIIAQKRNIKLTTEEIDEEMNYIISDEGLKEYLGEDSEKIAKVLQGVMQKGENKLSDVVKAFADSDSQRAAKRLEKELARPAIKPVLKGVATILLFLVGILVARLLLLLLSVVKIIPIAKTGVSFAGALLGLGQGVIIVLVVANAIAMAVESGAMSDSIINEDIIEKTKIFKTLCG
ncbi:MAG: CvpA family protein [Oscillospiraceae bacterium]|nr:CvpA family protein [Oscillospiraceae bacterium]